LSKAPQLAALAIAKTYEENNRYTSTAIEGIFCSLVYKQCDTDRRWVIYINDSFKVMGSKPGSDGRVNRVNAITPEPLKGFEPKLTQILMTRGP